MPPANARNCKNCDLYYLFVSMRRAHVPGTLCSPRRTQPSSSPVRVCAMVKGVRGLSCGCWKTAFDH
eukprot:3794433-Prymnesium_polylepis.2